MVKGKKALILLANLLSMSLLAVVSACDINTAYDDFKTNVESVFAPEETPQSVTSPASTTENETKNSNENESPILEQPNETQDSLNEPSPRSVQGTQSFTANDGKQVPTTDDEELNDIPTTDDEELNDIPTTDDEKEPEEVPASNETQAPKTSVPVTIYQDEVISDGEYVVIEAPSEESICLSYTALEKGLLNVSTKNEQAYVAVDGNANYIAYGISSFSLPVTKGQTVVLLVFSNESDPYDVSLSVTFTKA